MSDLRLLHFRGCFERRYGGHIVNDFDRLLANEYLDWYMKDELLDETELYPFAEDEKGVSFLVRLSALWLVLLLTNSSSIRDI